MSGLQLTVRRALLAFTIIVIAVRAQAAEVDRLMTLARVWSTVKYLDPAFVTSGVDWDAALTRAIPAVRASKSDDEFAAAVDSMLRELRDPATRVASIDTAAAATADVPPFKWNSGVLVINAGPYVARHDVEQFWAGASAMQDALAKAAGAVIDLRTERGKDAEGIAAAVGTLENLTRTDLVAPASRYLFHSGYAPQSGGSSSNYQFGFLVIPGRTFAAARDGAPARIAFVVNARSTLPSAALALRDAGTAVIISSAPVGDEVAVDTQQINLGDRHVASVRTNEIMVAGVQSDIVDVDPIAAAIRFASGETAVPRRPQAASTALPAVLRFPPEREYREMTYPDVNYRLLAAFRLWSVIDLFYPHKSLIGDWDSVLREFIPRFIDAKDADEYGRAVMEMDARVEDGHSSACCPPFFWKLIGSWTVPFSVRPIEREYVVTDLFAADLPVRAGDVVVSVDGEPMADRVKRLWTLMTASTENARRALVATAALRGDKNSTAQLELRNKDGIRKVSVARVRRAPQKSSVPYRILHGNIGYVDLTRLTVAEVDAMFDLLINTKAIVFDMRGYPAGNTFYFIAPRINTGGAKIAARFRRRQLSGAATAEEASAGFVFEQTLPMSEKPKFRGKTVMLIDERAMSAAETTALWFEAASGTTFIGTPTAGANGTMTNFPLPGGFQITFTGDDVRHADGRQLQRVGIQPDIFITPTIAGVRAGRDEVLEQAIKYLRDPGTSPRR